MSGGSTTARFFFVQELQHFYNDGFGWICRNCEIDLKKAEGSDHSRLLHEGEAESKTPNLSTTAIARWLDPAQRILVCPRCGISELADIQ